MVDMKNAIISISKPCTFIAVKNNTYPHITAVNISIGKNADRLRFVLMLSCTIDSS